MSIPSRIVPRGRILATAMCVLSALAAAFAGYALADTFNGNDNDNVMLGTTGNDDFFAEGGNDAVFGNSGNDDLGMGWGGDSGDGEGGADTIEGKDGNDDYVFFFFGGNKGLTGGGASDVIDGDANQAGADYLLGNTGNDILRGGPGGDAVDGVDDSFGDTIRGGDGTSDACAFDYRFVNPNTRDFMDGCEFPDGNPVGDPS